MERSHVSEHSYSMQLSLGRNQQQATPDLYEQTKYTCKCPLISYVYVPGTPPIVPYLPGTVTNEAEEQ